MRTNNCEIFSIDADKSGLLVADRKMLQYEIVEQIMGHRLFSSGKYSPLDDEVNESERLMALVASSPVLLG